jgi:hypothetical protein
MQIYVTLVMHQQPQAVASREDVSHLMKASSSDLLLKIGQMKIRLAIKDARMKRTFLR